jgi:pantoate--beta-alanine ligase
MLSEQFRKKGKKIVFVPTMGALHEGHLSLMKRGKKLGDILVISIFVNPIQFNQKEDYEKYPRDDKRDLELAESVGVDVAFLPSADEIYPPEFQTHVEVEKLTKNLCGAYRPGHFRGVTTVVAKLFNIVKPHIAIFGEKDFQQLKVIERMVKDLNFDIKIIPGKTVREKDGLAMSSRNARLAPEERNKAVLISRALNSARELFDSGERSAEKLIQKATDVMNREPALRVEYLKVVDAETLEDLEIINSKAVIATAVWLGNVRLIDNIMLGR